MDEIFVSKILIFSKRLWYNEDMKKHGFTLIEVAIFLAVTGALFAAVTIGVQNSIYQQRYNDTVQSFVDFLGDLYSEVLNVQNSAEGGRSDEAIYGKLVTFGEEDSGEDKQVIHTYDVVAKAVNSWDVGNQNTLTLLKNPGMSANVVNKEGELVGIIEDYTPRWAARIQEKESFEDYKGALLIVRNVQSGVVQTYVWDGDKETIEVKKAINEEETIDVFDINGEGESILNKFKSETVDYCVNPNGSDESNTRMDVRIVAGAHDESGIELISFDDVNYKCGVIESE